jgi:excisionase family DNA binding protein
MRQPVMESGNKLHRLQDVASILQCSKWKVYQMVIAGELEMVKLGRLSRISDRSLKKCIAQFKTFTTKRKAKAK